MKIIADIQLQEVTDRNQSVLAEVRLTIRHDELGDLTIRSCKVMKGENGPFLSFPQRQYEKDGERKYFRFINTSKEWRDELEFAAMKAFSDAKSKERKPAAV